MGQYAVTNEVAKTFRVVLQEGDNKNAFWRKILQEELKRVLLKVETCTEHEIDCVMSLVQEASFKRLSTGSVGMTKDNKLLTVLGYSTQQVTKDMTLDAIKALRLKTEFSDPKQMLVGLYYDPKNPERQEVVNVYPQDVIPVTDLDVEKTA